MEGDISGYDNNCSDNISGSYFQYKTAAALEESEMGLHIAHHNRIRSVTHHTPSHMQATIQPFTPDPAYVTRAAEHEISACHKFPLDSTKRTRKAQAAYMNIERIRSMLLSDAPTRHRAEIVCYLSAARPAAHD